MSTETASPSRIKTTWLIGIFAAFSIFAVIAGYSGHMTRAYTSYDQQRANDRYDTLQKLQAEEKALINPDDDKGNATADWIDQAKGTIHIPIDEAMAKEVDTLKGQPAQIGSALPAPPPPPAAAPAKPDAAASTNAAPTSARRFDERRTYRPAAPAKPTK